MGCAVAPGEPGNAGSDVLILGGGVIGLACALYLLREGRSVTVLEQGSAGAACSHGNCGTITPSHAMPLAMPGMIAQALRWMSRADAPFRVAPRLDFALIEWLLQFARRCNWNDFKRITANKAPLLLSRTTMTGSPTTSTVKKLSGSEIVRLVPFISPQD